MNMFCKIKIDVRSFDNEKSIKVPIIDILVRRPDFLPLAVPKQYLEDIEKFHDMPFVWWSGQIVYYLTRFNDHFASVIQKKGEKMDFKRPCVGYFICLKESTNFRLYLINFISFLRVHVRRTDKIGSEASFHELDEYMKHVDDYFNLTNLTQTINARNVFLASDDINVLVEAKKK
jgi:glycoprotein 6-alpha-L-fucosyltransferase